MLSIQKPTNINMREEQDQYSKALYELCSMIIQVFQSSPEPISLPTLLIGGTRTCPSSITSSSQLSPAAFSVLFLGVSVSLMLFGFVAFVIGFLLMPLVVGVIMLFYFAGMVSNFSGLSRFILWGSASSPDMVPPEYEYLS